MNEWMMNILSLIFPSSCKRHAVAENKELFHPLRSCLLKLSVTLHDWWLLRGPDWWVRCWCTDLRTAFRYWYADSSVFYKKYTKTRTGLRLYTLSIGPLVRSGPHFITYQKNDPRFFELHGSCESVSRELRKSGVGAQVKHAPVITPEEEKLWDSGAIGVYSPKALGRCVFYYVGKSFCLRGGEEHRSLKPSQFERGFHSELYSWELLLKHVFLGTTFLLYCCVWLKKSFFFFKAFSNYSL